MILQQIQSIQQGKMPNGLSVNGGAFKKEGDDKK
jgi:hypothetical protein